MTDEAAIKGYALACALREGRTANKRRRQWLQSAIVDPIKPGVIITGPLNTTCPTCKGERFVPSNKKIVQGYGEAIEPCPKCVTNDD